MPACPLVVECCASNAPCSAIALRAAASVVLHMLLGFRKQAEATSQKKKTSIAIQSSVSQGSSMYQPQVMACWW